MSGEFVRCVAASDKQNLMQVLMLPVYMAQCAYTIYHTLCAISFCREADGSCEWVVEDNAMGPADLVAIGERENVTYRFDDWLIKVCAVIFHVISCQIT
eukprot:SAG11_NODE_886_length_6730_cov_3.784195_1_plen_99_part_00